MCVMYNSFFVTFGVINVQFVINIGYFGSSLICDNMSNLNCVFGIGT